MEGDSYCDGCHDGLFRGAAAMRPLGVGVAVVVGAGAVNVLLDVAHPFLRAAHLHLVGLSDVDAPLGGHRQGDAVAVVAMSGVRAKVPPTICLLALSADDAAAHATLAADAFHQRRRVRMTQ